MRKVMGFFFLVLVVLLGAGGAVWFFPDIRPDFVKPWIRKATGFTPAQTPEEALDRFKRALQARDYETAALYCSGDYKDVLEKNTREARSLGTAIDDLRDAMKKQEVKSEKADFVLFMLDPFPASFQVKNIKKSGDDKAEAQIDWSEEVKTHAGQKSLNWQIDLLICNALLPRVAPGGAIDAKLERGPDGSWTIQLPVSIKDRHLRASTGYLEKNGSNFKNALVELKNEVKANAPTKESFEGSLKKKLEESK